MVNFSYYDTISNLIPGCIFLWGISFFGPLNTESGILSILTGNDIVDVVLFLVVAFFVGHIIQFFSKKIVEPMIKKIFWDGHFYSELVLLKPMKKIEPELYENVINYAKQDLKISLEKLDLLKDNEVISDEDKRKNAMKISNLIYRMIDAKIVETRKETKAQLQNTYYSLFRNFSMCFLALLSLNIVFFIMGLIPLNPSSIFNIFFMLILIVIFAIQAKERAELYINGLFWSIR